MTQIVQLRQDLRIHHQPALVRAAQAGPGLPACVLDDETPGDPAIGGARCWRLHHSLPALASSLDVLGGPSDQINSLQRNLRHFFQQGA